MAITLWAGLAQAQFPTPAPAPTAPAKPVNERSTPRGTIRAFLDACRLNDFEKAATFIDIDRSRRALAPAELARQLKEVLDRGLSFDPLSLSISPEGSTTDTADPNIEIVGSAVVGSQNITLTLERTKSVEGEQIWAFSRESVSIVPLIFRSLPQNAWTKNLPPWMQRQGFADTPVWKLLVMAVAGTISLIFAWTLGRFIIWILSSLLRRVAPHLNSDVVIPLSHPLRWLLALAVFVSSFVASRPSLMMRAYVFSILGLIFFLLVAWLLNRTVDVVAHSLLERMGKLQKATASSIVPLARRVIKTIILAIAILATLDYWGYNTTAILTGLGIGGVAVALAAQKTIEHLFGGVAIATDRPVLVGDFCRYGDKYGIVEDIGLRSTRIRTLDRTVVTIPNGDFSSLQIENFGKRDKIFLHPTLNLRRETTTDQLRELIKGLRQIMLDHPRMDNDPARVRFIGIGPSSFDLEIFAYANTANIDEFLIIQEEVMLLFLDFIRSVGTDLAIPATLNLVSPDQLKRAVETRSLLSANQEG